MHISSSQLRQKYLDFFRSKNHAIIPSAPLVPENDASVLFNTAGMQPLVPYLLGEKHPMGTRLADVQKCVRTGDIDDVGDDTHHTFFEMLGNWSLGDYFKAESIAWSWEFLTSLDWLGLDPRMLSVTVFEGDENTPQDGEAIRLWKEVWQKSGLDFGDERIARLPAEDNWWAAGPTGPCGPDTEIFYWVGEGEPQGNKGTHPKEWMEIWNNVFMEFNRKADGTLEPLPAQNIDTGMGLERTLAVINGKKTTYDTDFFVNTLEHIKRIVGEGNYNERGARIIADHIRTAVHMIADGVKPSNTDRGYVLRRLIRRAIREAHKMGHEDACLAQVARDFITIYAPVYTSVADNEALIIDEISREEEKFQRTLVQGMREFEKKFNYTFQHTIKALSENGEEKVIGPGETTIFGGEDMFYLFETYGFPGEMTLELLREKTKETGIQLNNEQRILEEFNEAMKKHADLSRTASAGMFKGGLADHSDVTISLHTACHLMLAGLRKVLGEHVMQAGSNITPERLRFDFTHPEKMTPEQISAVESYVNGALKAHITVTMTEEPKESAKARGVLGAFWEKYPDIVKVYKMVGDDGVTYSEELCGGPHIEESSKMGTFKIQKEEASSAGVRRIKAVIQ